ncbi:hypothetical protein D3C75_1312420 [compost metagenome]
MGCSARESGLGEGTGNFGHVAIGVAKDRDVAAADISNGFAGVIKYGVTLIDQVLDTYR